MEKLFINLYDKLPSLLKIELFTCSQVSSELIAAVDGSARCNDAEYIFLIINSTFFSIEFPWQYPSRLLAWLLARLAFYSSLARFPCLAAIITHKTIAANDIASSISTKLSWQRALNKDEIMFSDKYP